MPTHGTARAAASLCLAKVNFENDLSAPSRSTKPASHKIGEALVHAEPGPNTFTSTMRQAGRSQPALAPI